MSVPAVLDGRDEPSETMISRAVGEELRRVREARGWSRGRLVAELPSGIGERTLLSYEHGARQLTVLRLIEIARRLGLDAPTLLTRALQRARIHLDAMPLTIDLHALLRDDSITFRPLVQWARNALNEHPGGVMAVEPVVARNLALFIGCATDGLATYLARFLPDGDMGGGDPSGSPRVGS